MADAALLQGRGTGGRSTPELKARHRAHAFGSIRQPAQMRGRTSSTHEAFCARHRLGARGLRAVAEVQNDRARSHRRDRPRR